MLTQGVEGRGIQAGTGPAHDGADQGAPVVGPLQAAAGGRPGIVCQALGLPPDLGQGGANAVGNTYNGVMWGRQVELAGGANIAAGRIPVGFSPLSPEVVLAAAPQHVFITASSWINSPDAVRAGYDVDVATTRRTLAPYAARPGWPSLPAIHDGELHAIETGLSRSLWDWVGSQYIAKQLHPAAFADVDPVDSLRRYHERFLPVSFEGCWMARLAP